MSGFEQSTAFAVGIATLVALPAILITARRACAHRDWDLTSTYIFLVGLLGSLPIILFVVRSGQQEHLDPLGNLVMTLPPWVGVAGAATKALVAAAAFTFFIGRILRGTPINTAPAIAILLVVVLSLSDGLNGHRAFGGNQLLLPVAACGVLLAVAGGVQAIVEPSSVFHSIEKSSADAPPLVKASVVGDPGPPSAPTSPRPALNLAIGLLSGAVVGVAGAVLRHSLDATVRSAGDVRRRLGLTTVCALPKPHRRRTNGGTLAGTTRRDEALSQLRTRLRFASKGRMPSSLLVTSSLPGEGRTETAIGLATNVARTGRRVVLVEADARRPRLAETLGLPQTAGLTDVITGEVTLDDALQRWEAGPIRVLTSGTPPPDPSTLLSSRYMTQLLRTLEADADLVVVDSPPLLPFADAATLASETEGVLLVIRSGKTRYDLARSALDSLAAVRAHILGAVLTGTPPERLTGRNPHAEAAQQSDASAPEHRPPPLPTDIRAPAGHHR